MTLKEIKEKILNDLKKEGDNHYWDWAGMSDKLKDFIFQKINEVVIQSFNELEKEANTQIRRTITPTTYKQWLDNFLKE